MRDSPTTTVSPAKPSDVHISLQHRISSRTLKSYGKLDTLPYNEDKSATRLEQSISIRVNRLEVLCNATPQDMLQYCAPKRRNAKPCKHQKKKKSLSWTIGRSGLLTQRYEKFGELSAQVRVCWFKTRSWSFHIMHRMLLRGNLKHLFSCWSADVQIRYGNFMCPWPVFHSRSQLRIISQSKTMHIQAWTVPLKKIIALKASCLKPRFGRCTSLDVGNSNCHYGENYMSWLFVISKRQSFWYYVWNTICVFTFRGKRSFFSDALEDFLPHMLYGMHYPNLSSVLFKNNISWCYVTYDLHLFWGTVVLLSSLDMMNICKSFSDILTVLHIHSHKPIVSHH